MESDIKIFKTKQILDDFDYHIKNKIPWALCRFGDGGLKLIHSVLFNDQEQLQEIVKKEGIPLEKSSEIVDLWATSANICNYIDTPEVYFSGTFWPRVRKGRKPMHEETINKMKEWKKLHLLMGITNERYCNPEINFLSCLDTLDRSLLEIIENKNICCITAYPQVIVRDKLKMARKVDVVQIVENNQDHYHNSFNRVIVEIKSKASYYDLWLVAAGELGRIYTGIIKYKEGISFDIGSIIDYWCKGTIPLRLFWFLKSDEKNPLKLCLTNDGKEFENYI